MYLLGLLLCAVVVGDLLLPAHCCCGCVMAAAEPASSGGGGSSSGTLLLFCAAAASAQLRVRGSIAARYTTSNATTRVFGRWLYATGQTGWKALLSCVTKEAAEDCRRLVWRWCLWFGAPATRPNKRGREMLARSNVTGFSLLRAQWRAQPHFDSCPTSPHTAAHKAETSHCSRHHNA